MLSYGDIQMFLKNEALRSQQLRALNRFLHFFGLSELGPGSITRTNAFNLRAAVWMKSHWGEVPHNYLRITRILDSLQLLGNHHVAMVVQNAFLHIAKDHPNLIEAETQRRWIDAVSRHGPYELGPNMVRIGPMLFADEDDFPIQNASLEAILQLNTLEALDSMQARVDAVATDLPFGGHFNLIPPGVLASTLGIDFNEAPDEYAEFTARMSIDDFAFDELAECLEDYVSAERMKAIQEEGSFDTSELAEADRIEIETSLTLSRLGEFNGDYPWVKRWHLRASNGGPVSFQVCQGDGGLLLDVRGPYQIAVIGLELGDDAVISDFKPY